MLGNPTPWAASGYYNEAGNYPPMGTAFSYADIGAGSLHYQNPYPGYGYADTSPKGQEMWVTGSEQQTAQVATSHGACDPLLRSGPPENLHDATEAMQDNTNAGREGEGEETSLTEETCRTGKKKKRKGRGGLNMVAASLRNKSQDSQLSLPVSDLARGDEQAEYMWKAVQEWIYEEDGCPGADPCAEVHRDGDVEGSAGMDLRAALYPSWGSGVVALFEELFSDWDDFVWPQVT